MRPPAEQVVRDYLNRLSVVARSRLQPEDRRAFLARTRDYIERQSGVREMTDPADVMRVLNDYGEPEALVERERARLEARRSERERTAAASKAGFWKPRPPGGARGRDGDDDGAPPSPYAHLTRKDGRPVAGEIKKSVHLRYPNYSGTLATAGGLIFLGLLDGTVAAFDDTTLDELWKINTGSGFCAPPMTFEVNGKQYLAIASGLSAPARAKLVNTPELKEIRNATVLYVFAL